MLDLVYPGLSRGLVADWCTSKQGRSSVRLLDYSRNNNFGDLTSMDPATDWVLSGGKMALDFDGSNDYVRVAAAPSLGSFSAMSCFAWAKYTNASDTGEYALVCSPVTDSAIATDPYEHYALFLANNKVRCDLSTGSPGSRVTTISTTSVTDTKWHHVGYTWNGTTVRLYIDGIEDATTGAFSGTTSSSSIDIRLGAFNSQGVGDYFLGQIDNVRIHKVNLRTVEVRTLAKRRGIAYETRRPTRMMSVAAPTGSTKNNMMIGCGF